MSPKPPRMSPEPPVVSPELPVMSPMAPVTPNNVSETLEKAYLDDGK